MTAASWDPKCRDHSQLAAVTHFVIPADCSHRACYSSQLAVKSNPNGITNPVAVVSWDHKLCDCSQLGSQKVLCSQLGSQLLLPACPCQSEYLAQTHKCFFVYRACTTSSTNNGSAVLFNHATKDSGRICSFAPETRHPPCPFHYMTIEADLVLLRRGTYM